MGLTRKSISFILIFAIGTPVFAQAPTLPQPTLIAPQLVQPSLENHNLHEMNYLQFNGYYPAGTVLNLNPQWPVDPLPFGDARMMGNFQGGYQIESMPGKSPDEIARLNQMNQFIPEESLRSATNLGDEDALDREEELEDRRDERERRKREERDERKRVRLSERTRAYNLRTEFRPLTDAEATQPVVDQIGQANDRLRGIGDQARCTNDCAPTAGLGQNVGSGGSTVQVSGAMANRLQQLVTSHPNARDLSSQAVQDTLQFLRTRSSVIQNQNVITIIDYTKPSNQRRMFVFNLQAGTVQKEYVAHGVGSGTGAATTSFSNRNGSRQSSQGFFVTGEVYNNPRNGRSMRLRGLDATNRAAEARGIVIHGSAYATEDFVRRNGRAGNSHGCPAVDRAVILPYINLTRGGSLVYSFGGSIPTR